MSAPDETKIREENYFLLKATENLMEGIVTIKQNNEVDAFETNAKGEFYD